MSKFHPESLVRIAKVSKIVPYRGIVNLFRGCKYEKIFSYLKGKNKMDQSLKVRKKYNRIAGLYDLLTSGNEKNLALFDVFKLFVAEKNS